MPTVTSDGVEIAYELDGPADGDPVVLIEGLGYGRWMWRWQREALADEFRVVLPDNRGTGDSATPEGPYTIEGMAADVEAVLEDVDVGRAHVVGASMGGMIALQYALDYDRAATLSLLATSPGGPDSVPVPESTREQMYAVGDDERDTIRRRMRPAVSDTFYEDEPETVERIVDWRLEQDADEDARTAQAAAVEAFDVSDRLDAIVQPTQLLHGDADRVVPIENGRLLHDRLPNSELDVVEGGSHLCFVEEAEAVSERLRRFFDRNAIATTEGR